MMHILEGESLLNDASGLVCLRFAIAAALTGAFSIQDAAFNFLWVAFGGIAVGTGVTWEIGRASCRGRVCQYVKISVFAVSLKKNKIRKYSYTHQNNHKNEYNKQDISGNSI